MDDHFSTEALSSSESHDQNIKNNPHRSVVERYYTPKFVLDCQANEDEDLCILTHSNRICIVTLAETHPILRDKKTITEVSFKIGDVDRLRNKVSGKGKRGAQELSAGSPLCLITCEDGEKFTVYSGVKGQLIEVNENLMKQPDLILRKPQTQGYIAIVLPKLKEYDQIMKKLKSETEYRARRKQNTVGT